MGHGRAEAPGRSRRGLSDPAPTTKRSEAITIVNTDLAARLAPVAAARGPGGGPFLAGDTLERLTLESLGRLRVAWAPFEHTPGGARLAVVGITPGRQQAENALAAFAGARREGESLPEALRRAKLVGAFSGAMRANLVAMLDRVGAQRALGVTTCAELFDPARDRAHFTSALRYPVFLDGANYNGTPDPLATPMLRRLVETCLAEEARALPAALWLPLGPVAAAALRHLVVMGVLDRGRVLDGLPHPSGANGERIAYFLGRKPREALSRKTRPFDLDRAREELAARVARLAGASA